MTSNRKRHLFLLLAIGSGLAMAAACSFPDVTFAPDEPATEAGSDAPVTEDGGDAMVVDTGLKPTPSNPDVDPDGGGREASTLDSAATTPVDVTGCTTCDCDGDGYNRFDLDAGCDGGGGAGGVDCDDTIEAINPGHATANPPRFISNIWPTASTHTPAGDWDCNGTVTYQYDYEAACGGLSLKCAGGFVGKPPCGTTADFLTCQELLVPLVGLLCSEKTRELAGARTQACR